MGGGASSSKKLTMPRLDLNRLSLTSSPQTVLTPTSLITPRLAVKAANFVVIYTSENDPEAIEKYLYFSSDGKLSLAPTAIYKDEWRIRYLDLDWPQQYFRVCNNNKKLYLCAKMDENNQSEEQKGIIFTMPRLDEGQTFDKSYIFYLSPSTRGSDYYIVNTMFGMTFCVNEEENNEILLVPTPDIPTSNMFFQLKKVS